MRRAFTGSALAVVVALSLAACGSSNNDSGSTASSTNASKTNSSGTDLAAIDAQVAKDESGDATFPGPTEAFTPGSKKMMLIACSFTAPVCVTAEKEAAKAVKAMGWTTDGPQDGKFSPQVQAGLLNKAVQGKYGGVVMIGIDVNSIKSAVEQTIAAKIPIGCINCYSIAYRNKPGTVIDVAPSFKEQGNQMGRYLISKNKGKAKVVTFNDTAYPQTGLRAGGVQETLKASCPDCTVQKIPMSVGEVAKPGPPTWTATLSKNPSGTLTDAAAMFDGIGLVMAKTVKSQGRSDITMNGYDADVPVVKGLADGSLTNYGATIGGPIAYAAWGATDEVGRVVAGKEQWDGTDLPNVTITKNNASQYPTGDFEPKGDWQANFLKLWGKS
jgi:ABC-type sugar transport system substrate-binding protein